MYVNHHIGTNHVVLNKSAYGTFNVVSYVPENKQVNEFLHLFDIWGSHGEHKPGTLGEPETVWFEVSKEFAAMCVSSKEMSTAFKRMGAELVVE